MKSKLTVHSSMLFAALSSAHSIPVAERREVRPSVFYTRWYREAEDTVATNGTYAADPLEEGARGSLLYEQAVPAG